MIISHHQLDETADFKMFHHQFAVLWNSIRNIRPSHHQLDETVSRLQNVSYQLRCCKTVSMWENISHCQLIVCFLQWWKCVRISRCQLDWLHAEEPAWDYLIAGSWYKTVSMLWESHHQLAVLYNVRKHGLAGYISSQFVISVCIPSTSRCLVVA